MKLLFMGSGRFAVPSLRVLLDSSHEVQALFTQPDKPAGRGHELRSPPTKELALKHSVRVHQPKNIRDSESVSLIQELAPECIVVAAYGQIIPKSILHIPSNGIINIHASILPAYRGAAPIQWAIVRGETETGVTTMLMDEGLDTGAIILQESLSIEPDDTSRTLEDKLARVGADLVLETLRRWERGSITPIPQSGMHATFAPRIKQVDAFVNWNHTSVEIERAVRGFIPWPVAHTTLSGKKIKLWGATVIPADESTAGVTISVDRKGIVVGCGGGTCLRLLELQAEGKKRMPATDFASGQHLSPGDRWGE